MNRRSKLTVFLCLFLCLIMTAGSMPVQPAKADELTDVWFGDVNDDEKIDAKDVTMLRRQLAGGWNVNINEEKADLNQDDEINAKNVTMLRRYMAGGWGVELPTKTIAFETMPIDAKSFPDDNFRNYVLEKIDTDKDGILSLKEAEDVKNISTSINSEIKSLKGIEYFSKLEDLTCSFNQITELDLSHNRNLKYLDCFDNQLTVLDLSQCTKLEKLDCTGNQLTTLDVNQNTALKSLMCWRNQLSVIDVSMCEDFEDFNCSENQITNLDISNNPGLTVLHCLKNQLSTLDVSQNAALEQLQCDEYVHVIR